MVKQKINQEKVWDNIAEDWFNFKNNPDPNVIDFLKNSKKNEKVLDVGCASGRFFTKTNAKIYGIDFSQEMLKKAEIKAKKLNLDFELKKHDLNEKLPFEDNYFDKIICIAVLHCIEKESSRIKVIKEIKRVLKPSGKAMIKVWNKESIRFKNKEKNIYVKWLEKGERFYYLYNSEEIKKQVIDQGLKIESFKHKNQSGFESQEISIIFSK